MTAVAMTDTYVMDPLFAAKEARAGVVNLLLRLRQTDADVHDRLRRASIIACVQSVEALSAHGSERTARFRVARDHAGQAAAIIEAAMTVGLIDVMEAHGALARFHQLCAVLACVMHPRRA
jgi:hypothetical protein